MAMRGLVDHEDHVAADGPTEVAFSEESLRKGIEVGDLIVVLVCELVDGQESLFGIEREVAGVVVREVASVRPVANNEKLYEAEQRFGVTVAGVVLVFDDLLHGPTRRDIEGLQLDLHHWDAIDEQNDIVSMVAVVRVDAELIDDFEAVFAPVLDVDQRVVQRRAVVASESVSLTQGACGREDIRRDDLVEQASELSISEANVVECFELLAEVLLKGSSIADV